MPNNLPKLLLKFLAPVLAVYLVFFFAGNKFLTSGEGSVLSLYSDSVLPGWNNWSWGASINFDNPAPVNSGSKSVWMKLDAWGALFLHADSPLDLANYQKLTFAVYPQSDNLKLKLIVYDFNNNQVKTLDISGYTNPLVANQYNQVSIPVKDLGTSKVFGLAIQEAEGVGGKTMFIDDINFVGLSNVTSTPVPTTGNITAASGSGEIKVYSDSLSSDWNNWSWGGSPDFSSAGGVNTGSKLFFSAESAWAGLYLHTDNVVNAGSYRYLTFNLLPETDGQNIRLVTYDQDNRPIGEFKPLTNWLATYKAGEWNTLNIPLNDLGISSQNIKGVAFQEASGQPSKYFSLDNIKFTNTVTDQNTTLSKTALPSVTPIPSQTQAVNVSGKVSGTGYSVSNGNVYKNGSKINLKGVNWFGAETDTYVFHGLWARNYKDMISQMKQVGFNAIRVPVCPKTLSGVAPSSINYSLNPDLKDMNSLEVMDKILAEMNNQGMYILLDHHRPDCNAISELWYTPTYSEQNWINDLRFMAERYKDLPNFVGIDLKNEPHNAATWGTGNASTDWNLAAERAGKEVLAIDPDILIFVEGVGENPVCSSSLGHGWGGNLEAVNCKPISESMIPANKLVYSPHAYGPEVFFHSYFSDPTFPDNMPSIWNTQFGSLKDKGYTVILGEWGGKYGTTGGDIKESQYLDKLADYMVGKGMCSSFYWSFNPNSGDTGGILKDDWTNVWTEKTDLLKKLYSRCN